MTSACPCDEHGPGLPDNAPGLARVVARRDDWLSIRRALLEHRTSPDALAGWTPGGTGDLALMIAEWWATLGEVLEFYTDEIANEAFLGTATRRESVARLIALLGYRPRPALAATARLAALVTGREAIALPQGFAIESIPAPGQQPQTFELDAPSLLQPGGRILAGQPPALAAPEVGLLLLEGKVRSLVAGEVLRLRTDTGSQAITVVATEIDGAVTRLEYTSASPVPPTARAATSRLERASVSLPVWTFKGKAVGDGKVHLAALSRAVTPGDAVLVTGRYSTPIAEAINARRFRHASILVGVTATRDLLWYANPPGDDPAVSPGDGALPVPHTVLTLDQSLDDWIAASMTIGAGWVPVAPLLDQSPPPWTGSPASLQAIGSARFAQHAAAPVLLAGAQETGAPAALTSATGERSGTLTVDPAYGDGLSLEAPIAILDNLLSVTRGKTVAHEVLGNGDAKIAGQSFALAKAPVTYVRRGAGFASSVTVLVGGVPWREVESFYGQPADAAVFTLAEREDGRTLISFGDGVNGRRLPTGVGNVVARYRHGAGAETPAAGKLTRLPSSWPGLDKVLNPVAAGGGADAQAASAIRRYAPRSVLTLGRAVSVADFAAFAADAAAPNRTRTVWSWDEVRQRAAVTIHVAGGAAVRAVVQDAVRAVGDPHRPVTVDAAVALPIALSLTLVVAPGYETPPIVAAVTAALVGEDGLFSAAKLGIGQSLFASAISLAVLEVPGVVTIRTLALRRTDTGAVLRGALHRAEENQWFDLPAAALTIGCEVADG